LNELFNELNIDGRTSRVNGIRRKKKNIQSSLSIRYKYDINRQGREREREREREKIPFRWRCPSRGMMDHPGRFYQSFKRVRATIADECSVL